MESKFQKLNHTFPKVKVTPKLQEKMTFWRTGAFCHTKKKFARKIVPRTFDVLLVSLEVEILKNS